MGGTAGSWVWYEFRVLSLIKVQVPPSTLTSAQESTAQQEYYWKVRTVGYMHQFCRHSVLQLPNWLRKCSILVFVALENCLAPAEMSGRGEGKKSTPMTKEDASRIQSSEAKKHGGEVSKDSFAARAQSAADKNDQNWPNWLWDVETTYIWTLTLVGSHLCSILGWTVAVRGFAIVYLNMYVKVLTYPTIEVNPDLSHT